MNTPRSRTWSGLLVLGLLGFGSVAEGKVVYVAKTGSDANDGLSWPTAKVTVQAGLNAAVAGDEVWVAAGTYAERITLIAEVALFGGFAGTETRRVQRDGRRHVTTLDGKAGGSVVTFAAGVQAGGIDGFTIQNGSGVDIGNDTFGGGVYCDFGVAPAIVNNIIRANRADSGGGIFVQSASPAIQGNTILENAASAGGGIYCVGSCSPTIVSNVIVGNSSNLGAGIACTSGARPLIINNTMAGNRAKWGSIALTDSSPTILNTIIAFNTTGLYVSGAADSVLRSNCVFGNTDFNYSGLADPTGTDGNISADPRLANLKVYGNVHLLPGSPCIDAGDDAAVQPGWLDIDGQPRMAPAHVDIGADESDGTAWTEGPYVIVRVSPDGNDLSDGTSWDLAKKTVQAAIEIASAAGGEVWVKAGLYPERIILHPYAYVYGGFAGTETQREQRDWHKNKTILDGQAGGAVVTVLVGSQVSRIDGFTVRNGTGFQTPGYPSLTFGGGIWCDGSSPTIAHCAITGNVAQYGGGLYFSYTTVPTILDCVISGNAAGIGGAIHCRGATIINCTITSNRATAFSGGEAIYVEYTSFAPRLINTIVAFNSGGLAPDPSDTSIVRHCCVYGNTRDVYPYTSLPAYQNISTDPWFVRTPNAGADGKWATADDDLGDLHLKAGSPCIDAGDNGAVPADILTDLDGVSRYFNDPATLDTGLGAAPIVDMGAYEYLPGDFDRDGDIDAEDLKAFAACVSAPTIPYAGDCTGADFDKDGDVDQSDFGFLQRCFSGAGKAVDPACTN